MNTEHRSGCPINLTLEILGDKWSLLVIRDIIFGNKRHFRELLTKSQEGFASNILADRLERLVDVGVLTKASDPGHKQRIIYSLTAMGIALVPVLAQMSIWGRGYLPVSKELSARAKVLEEGGPELWQEFMDELHKTHISNEAISEDKSVRRKLQHAYEMAMKERSLPI